MATYLLQGVVFVPFLPAIHPQSNLMLVIWGIQTLSFLYNLWIIPFRVCFAIYQSESNAHIWMAMDYFMDLLYVLDMVLLKSRISFMNSDGIFESGRKRMLENYVRNGTFKQDLLSLLPLDLLYLLTGFTGPATILRAPRLLRYYHFELFFDRLDATLPYPVFIRYTR